MSAGAIRSMQRVVDGQHACAVAGVDATRDKIVTLQQLKDGLDEAIVQLEREQDRYRFVNKTLLVASFTKATCDAFLGLAEGMTAVFLGKAGSEPAKLINSIYKIAVPAVEINAALNNKDLPSLSSVMSLTREIGGPIGNPGVKLLVDTTSIKIEIVNAAMKNEKEELLKKAREYSTVTLVAALKQAQGASERSGQMKTAGGIDKLNEFIGMVTVYLDYNYELNNSINEHFSNVSEMTEVFDNARLAYIVQSRRLAIKIKEMDAFVQACPPVLELSLH